MEDYRNIYIKGSNDPFFVKDKVETVSKLESVISKIYLILLTNKGDVISDYEFGADIPKYLWKTNYPTSIIEETIEDQFSTYIPELTKSEYEINVYLLPGKMQDVGVINIDLYNESINIVFK